MRPMARSSASRPGDPSSRRPRRARPPPRASSLRRQVPRGPRPRPTARRRQRRSEHRQREAFAGRGCRSAAAARAGQSPSWPAPRRRSPWRPRQRGPRPRRQRRPRRHLNPRLRPCLHRRRRSSRLGRPRATRRWQLRRPLPGLPRPWPPSSQSQFPMPLPPRRLRSAARDCGSAGGGSPPGRLRRRRRPARQPLSRGSSPDRRSRLGLPATGLPCRVSRRATRRRPPGPVRPADPPPLQCSAGWWRGLLVPISTGRVR
jgi:hypothetical protein